MLATTSAPDSGAASITSPVQSSSPSTRVATRDGRGTRQAGTPVTRRDATPTAAATPVVAVALPPAAAAYDREIVAMRALITERRKDLDPVTVRVLERNLKIIDQAIAESRAALVQDPASGLLAEQLTRAMRRKLELLRTAADLPARIS